MESPGASFLPSAPACAPQCETQHWRLWPAVPLAVAGGLVCAGGGEETAEQAGPGPGKDRHREAVWEKASSGLETQQEPSRPLAHVCASDQTALSRALHGRGPSYAQSRGLRQGRPRKCWGSRRGKLDWGPGIGWSEWGKVREGPSRSMEWGKSVLAHPAWDNSGVTQHD